MATEEVQSLLSDHHGQCSSLTGDGHSAGHVDQQALEKALVKKLDRRVIDRNNVAAARLRGFERDLNLEGNQFATILSVMYIGYILMQIPSNMILNHIGKPSLYLPVCMMLWGTVSFCTGFVTSYRAALCTRFMLGFAEAAFFPGALFLISKWYRRKELSFRMALLVCGSIISNAFGSLIASAILGLADNWLGYAAWRWLFFIEGGLTIVVAFVAMFVLPDFPETSFGWLSSPELELAQRRMIDDGGSAISLVTDDGTDLQFHSGFFLAMSDWKVWWLALTMATMVAALSFHAYFPTLVATIGYNSTITLLLCAPPWVFATFAALFLSIHSDRVQERFWHIILSLLVGCVGFGVAISTVNIAIRYASFFLMAQMYAGFVCFLAWVSGSFPHRPSKRAVALAFINCFSQLGNALAVYAWPSSWGPSYRMSYAFCLGVAATCSLMCYQFRRELSSLNNKAALRVSESGGQTFRYLL